MRCWWGATTVTVPQHALKHTEACGMFQCILWCLGAYIGSTGGNADCLFIYMLHVVELQNDIVSG
jgi:hypothetical protein